MATQAEIITALITIRNQADKGAKALDWTGNYARHALVMIERKASQKDIDYQLLYVIDNLTTWRSTEARAIRKLLKSYVGVK